MNDDTLTNLIAHGLVDKVIHLFNKYLGTQLKITRIRRGMTENTPRAPTFARITR